VKIYGVFYDPVGQLEHVTTIDPDSGDVESIGALPATYQFFDDCIASEQGRFYIRSFPENSPVSGVLLVVDAPSGTLLNATAMTPPPPLTSLQPIGINSAGQTRAIAWDPNVPIEHMLDLDTATGVTTDLGTLPATYQEFGETVFDHPANRMYLHSGETMLTFDGGSGALLGAAPIAISPLANGNYLAANANGIFGFAWDASAGLQRIVKLNPATGVGVAVDTLPAAFTNFETASNYSTIDTSTNRILVLDGEGPRIHKLNASTGAYLGQTPLQLNGFVNPLCFMAH
jgi:hypothetical protein